MSSGGGVLGSSSSRGLASGPTIAPPNAQVWNERPRRLANSPGTKTEITATAMKIAAVSIRHLQIGSASMPGIWDWRERIRYQGSGIRDQGSEVTGNLSYLIPDL